MLVAQVRVIDFMRQILACNGYAKSPETYADNARVRTVEITEESGLHATLEFADRSGIVPIDSPLRAPR